MPADPVAQAALVSALEEAPYYPIASGGGRGVVTCGGGCYGYGVYVLAGMLRAAGYTGSVQVWHRGDAEPVPAALGEFGVEAIDAAAIAKAENVPVPGGWALKAFSLTRCRFDTVFFFDADAYPVAPVDAAFEIAEETGELFWPDLPNQNLKWAAFGRPPRPELAAVNGGQWLVNKTARRRELAVYAGLNDRWPAVYPHMHGDQDCQTLAWGVCNRQYRTGPPCHMVGPIMVFDLPAGTPAVVHRVMSKFAPAGCFTPTASFAGPVRGLPFEREAVRLYRKALDVIGIPKKKE